MAQISRKKRRDWFINYMHVKDGDRILDLGGGSGRHIVRLIPVRKNVTIADISKKALEKAKEQYGYNTVLLEENSTLPFSDNYFDIVFCNSVIEHVTISKNKIWNSKNGKEFYNQSLINQKKFADEIRRIGKNYFVQTPNKYFIFESHTWLPFSALLPRRILVHVIKLINRFWIKKTTPDWNLLREKELRVLFPDAIIKKERFLFMVKSLIAVKSDRI